MTKITFENVSEALSVPAFYMAYRELGDKYKLWGKNLRDLADFFDNLSAKNLRHILRAFGIRVILTDGNRAAFYAGGMSGLLLIDIPVPPEAMQPKKGRAVYVCPHCKRSVDTEFLDEAAVTTLATLYADETVERIRKRVVEFYMVQPIEVCFPYAGRKQWHEADVIRILVESILAKELGFPDICAPEDFAKMCSLLTEQLGFDIKKWAEVRARNIRQGIEPMPNFYGYKRVEDDSDERRH